MATQHALPFPHTTTELHALAKGWWIMLLRGLAAVAFGVLAFVWPGLTILTLIILFAVYALVDGLFALFSVFSSRDHGVPAWWLVLIGLLGIATAAITYFWPGITAMILVMIIGAWALVHGIFEIVAAFQLRKELDDWWMLALGGAISVIFGGLLLFNPGAGALALVWLIGIYAIIFGAILIILSFRLKSASARLPA
jgi:uncharacterized membrane protein HdeD (DUF308 family)